MNKTQDKPTGSPMRYKKEYAKQAYSYCSLGATDEQLAEFFDVNGLTINQWKKAHPDFCSALKRGKLMADANVAQSLYRIALGYTIDDRHYPPDLDACAYWLANRRPNLWKELQRSGTNTMFETQH